MIQAPRVSDRGLSVVDAVNPFPELRERGSNPLEIVLPKDEIRKLPHHKVGDVGDLHEDGKTPGHEESGRNREGNVLDVERKLFEVQAVAGDVREEEPEKGGEGETPEMEEEGIEPTAILVSGPLRLVFGSHSHGRVSSSNSKHGVWVAQWYRSRWRAEPEKATP